MLSVVILGYHKHLKLPTTVINQYPNALVIKVCSRAGLSATKTATTENRTFIMAKGITTDTQIKKAIAMATKSGTHTILPLAGYKGLELRIRPSSDDVTATFRHRYTHPYNGKRPYMTIGQYPAMTLLQARSAHHENMALLAQSIDPIEQRDTNKQEKINAMNNGFKAVAERWFEDNKKNQPAAKTVREWERCIKIATDEWKDTPIHAINAEMVLRLCKKLQQDKIDTGRRVRSMCERIFTYAIGHSLITANPATQIKGLLATVPAKHQPAITNPIQFAQLLRDIDDLDDSNERTALQLIALLFTRGGDMSSMKWSDIDFEAAQWTLAPQKGQGRSDMVDSLIIPLPRQAVAILKEQYEKTGMYEYVFHTHGKQKNDYMNMTRLSVKLGAIKDGYYKGKHVPHGFRASAITMIQEQLKYEKHLPDMQSGHVIKDNNGTAYNRVKFIDERTVMMQEWADYQDKLRAGTTIIRADFKQQVKAFG